MKTRQLSHIPLIMISFFQIGRSFRVRCILERIMQSSVPTRLLCAMASWRFVVLSVNQSSLQCLRFYIPWLNSARLITYPLLTWTFSCKKWHDNEQDCRRMGKDEPSHVNDNPPFSLWCPNGHLELTCLWWCLGRYIILNGSVPLYTSSMCTVLWMTFPAKWSDPKPSRIPTCQGHNVVVAAMEVALWKIDVGISMAALTSVLVRLLLSTFNLIIHIAGRAVIGATFYRSFTFVRM